MGAKKINAGSRYHQYRHVIYDTAIHDYTSYIKVHTEIEKLVQAYGTGTYSIIKNGSKFVITFDDPKTLTLILLKYKPPAERKYKLKSKILVPRMKVNIP